jgi:flagellar L-ring protein precursor FlgH
MKTTRLLLAFVSMLLAGAAGLRADSLWTEKANGSKRSMFADRRAAGVGDIVTIVVQESVAAQNSQKTTADKKSGADSSITQFLFPPAVSSFGTKGGKLPGTSFSGSNNFATSGEVNNSASYTARAAVLVTDVLPNGNFVVEGVRLVVAGGEKQYVVLRGIVRPDDVTAANTVLSSNVANASVEFLSEGNITNTQKKGWLTKIYETLRPY